VVPGDPVSEVTQAAVGYEAAGVLAWLPQSYEVIAVDEVFLAALDGDLYVDVTQIYSDFEAMGGAGHLVDFLAELAADDPTIELFPVDESGRAVPYVNSMGTEFYAFRSVDGGECYLSLYIPTLDGRLANMWISFPERQAAEYGEVAEFFVESLMLVEPGSDPVDIEGVIAAGQPAVSELVTENGVSFGAYGMEYSPEVEGWVCYEDRFVFVGTCADYLYGETGLTEDDLYYYAEELASEDGFLMAESYLVNGDTVVYTYAGLSDDGYIELYGFVPMADGTVTLVFGVADAADPASLDALAAVFQSIAYADAADAQGLDAIGGSEATLGSGSGAASTAPILDVEYLSRNATLG